MKIISKLLIVTLLLSGPSANACKEHTAGHSMDPAMQHGFVLSNDDKFGSHLVANGHHSRQTEVVGYLVIEGAEEREFYASRKQLNTDQRVYFLFQAQNLVLPDVKAGDVLQGHIVESQVGKYESKNIIVKAARFKIEKVLLNIENPFFGGE